MAEEFFAKIPKDTMKRINGYVAQGSACGLASGKEAWCDRITTACSVLYDCGFLSFAERVLASAHFRSRVYGVEEVAR